MGASRVFVYPFAGALLCNFSLHLAESPAGRARFRLQVQCRTLVGIIWKTKLSDCMKRKTHPHGQVFLFMESGNVLLSQVVSNQVPSALKGLTSVFGMGTGGSLSPLSPENCEGFVQSFVFLVSAPSLHNRSFHLGDFPHISRFIFYCAYPENRTSRLLTSCITSFPIFPLVSTQFS